MAGEHKPKRRLDSTLGDFEPQTGVLGHFEAFLVGSRLPELDPLTSERIRNVGIGILVAQFAFLGELFEGLRLGIPSVAIAGAVTVVVLSAVLLFLKSSRSYLVAGHVTLTVVVCALTFLFSVAGGFTNPGIMALAVIPIGAAVLINVSASVFWGVLSLLILCGFWIAGNLGATFSEVPEGGIGLNAFVNRAMIISGIVALISVFVRGQKRAELRMRKALREIEREAAHVDLLKEAAIAANEAVTVREAIEKCLGQICKSKGWPLAHGYDMSTTSDGEGTALFVGDSVNPAQQRLVRDAFGLLADSSADSSNPSIPIIGHSALWDDQLAASKNPYRRALAEKLGLRSRVLVALKIGERGWVLEFFSTQALEPDPSFVEVLHATGTLLSRVLERTLSRSRIHDLSYSDALTGLPNRRHLGEALEAMIRVPRAAGEHIVLLQVGLDRFKMVNDALGHATGDKLLSKVSDRLLGVLAAAGASEGPVENLTGDRIFRVGGDEFTIVLEGVRTPATAAILGQRILDRLAEPLSIRGREIFATASIGIAISGIDADNAGLLQGAADAALAAAKEEGGAKLRFYASSLNEASKRRLFLEHRLRRAIKRNEFTLNYQPLLSAKDGSMVAAEALLRWTTGDDERVSPAEFIPVAESTGQIPAIGAWVLEQACLQLAAWRSRGIGPKRVAVNVSVEQLREEDFVDTVLRIIKSTDLPKGALELEITESRLIGGEPRIFERLERLRDSGISLALDDFGTGYSSLSQLKRLPISKLKIDRSFVDGIETDENNLALARAVVQIGRGLGLTIVAEGVENEEQAAIMRAEGADELQGYLFSRPLPAADLEKLYAEPEPLVIPAPATALQPAPALA